jgi:hypothetical protein
MDEMEKLRMLIPYWIAHNQEHAKEFLDWANQYEDVKGELQAAAGKIDDANKILEEALEKLGGALPYDHPHSH